MTFGVAFHQQWLDYYADAIFLIGRIACPDCRIKVACILRWWFESVTNREWNWFLSDTCFVRSWSRTALSLPSHTGVVGLCCTSLKLLAVILDLQFTRSLTCALTSLMYCIELIHRRNTEIRVCTQSWSYYFFPYVFLCTYSFYYCFILFVYFVLFPTIGSSCTTSKVWKSSFSWGRVCFLRSKSISIIVTKKEMINNFFHVPYRRVLYSEVLLTSQLAALGVLWVSGCQRHW